MAINKDDLLDYNLKIYQDDEYFKFSIDSVLLAEFVNVKFTDKNLLDMCCGNAPLLLILNSKNNNLKYFGIELQKEVYSLAEMSIHENQANINLINDDIKNMGKYFSKSSLDIITCNPPYFKNNINSLTNKNEVKSIARHEVKTNLEEVVSLAKEYLKVGGYFYLVHRSDRLMEIIETLKNYKFSIKRLRFAYKNKDKISCCVLFECVKEGKTDTLVEPPIFIDDFK